MKAIPILWLALMLGVTSVAAAAQPVVGPAVVEKAIADVRATMLTNPNATIAKAINARALASKLPGQIGAVDYATATWLLGEAYVRNGDLAKGGPLIEEALSTIAAIQPNSKLHGDVLLSRGNYNALSARVGPALKDMQSSFRIYRKIGENRGEAIVLVTIATLYLDANDYQTALKYVDQALEIYNGDPQFLVSLHNNRGDMLREMKRYSEAETEFRKALALASSLKSNTLALPILRNIARNELAAGRIDAAERTVTQAFALLRRGGVSDDRAKVLAVAAQLRLEQHRLPEAKRYIEQAFVSVGTGADNVQFWQARTTAYAIYKALGDKANALAQLEALKTMDDNTAKLAASTNTALMAARFDSANQDLKIAKLQADDARRKLDFEHARAVTQLWMFVGSALAAIVIVGMLGVGLITIRKSRDQVRATNIDLAATNTALGKALAAKTEFLATTSHEIRTPLNGILGMTQVMLADQKLDTDTRDRIGVVHGAGVSMRALVDDILDVAKMETGNLTIEKAPVDLPDLLHDVSRIWEDQARAKGLAFILDVDHGAGCIESDPSRLRQVVFNLLSNALKFTRQGSIELSSNVIAGGTGEQVAIVVRDTGIGIPPDKRDLIFESFRQADAGTTRRFGGTGLGLSICRNIARAMGGDVTVTSEPGVGSTFTFLIPLVRADLPIVTDTAEAQTRALLIVDKNPISRSVLKTLLTPHTGAVAVAGSIDEAVAMIAKGGVERVLIDENTIAMNGGVENGVRALTGVSLSLLWTNPSDGDRRGFAKAGIDQLIAKPIAGTALVREIVGKTANVDIDSRAA